MKALRSLHHRFFKTQKTAYLFKRIGHKVFVEWLAPLESWSDATLDNYSADLRKNVRASLDDESCWKIVSRGDPSAHQDYHLYVKGVREKLIEEYSLQEIAEEIEIGDYYDGILVLSFFSNESAKYPNFYCGIQLEIVQENQSLQ